MSNILVVEDEAHLAEGLRFNLEAEGYQVNVVDNGEAALELFENQPNFDAVVLDVMLPGKDGFTVISELRKAGQYVPTLMLTARGHPEDVLKGFSAGADDYLTKPFDLNVLLARLNALLRRMSWPRQLAQIEPSADNLDEFTFSGRRIDFDALELHAPDRMIRLTLMEADLLRYLVRNRERIVSRKELLEQVWHVREDTDTRAIDNFIVRLRRYIEDDPAMPKHLETVRGIGYRFLPNPE